VPSKAPKVPFWLLRLLRARDGVEAVPGPKPGRLEVRVSGGPAVHFTVITEPRLTEERARRLRGHAGGKRPVLLATNRATEEVRSTLRRKNVSWAERDTGVLYLCARGLLVDLRQTQAVQRSIKPGGALERPTQLRGRSALVVETLLLDWADGRTSITLGDVATTARVSRQLASRVLRRLESETLLTATGKKRRGKAWTIADAGAILDRWAEEERTDPEHSVGLYVWTRSARELSSRLLVLSRLGIIWALGGVYAANLYAPTLTADPTPSLWLPADVAVERVARAVGGEIVTTGASVNILQTSGDPALNARRVLPVTQHVPEAPELFVVSPPRAYIEARASSGRGPDVAQNLRLQFLARVHSETAAIHTASGS